MIKSPIHLERISQKLKTGTYNTLDEMMADLVLMFDNACKYNEPDSQVYKVRPGAVECECGGGTGRGSREVRSCLGSFGDGWVYGGRLETAMLGFLSLFVKWYELIVIP